jgi:hypothetical protein
LEVAMPRSTTLDQARPRARPAAQAATDLDGRWPVSRTIAFVGAASLALWVGVIALVVSLV